MLKLLMPDDHFSWAAHGAELRLISPHFTCLSAIMFFCGLCGLAFCRGCSLHFLHFLHFLILLFAFFLHFHFSATCIFLDRFSLPRVELYTIMDSDYQWLVSKGSAFFSADRKFPKQFSSKIIFKLYFCHCFAMHFLRFQVRAAMMSAEWYA